MQIPELNENAYEKNSFYHFLLTFYPASFLLLYLEQMFSFFVKLFYGMFTFYNFTIPLLPFQVLHFISRAEDIIYLSITFIATYVRLCNILHELYITLDKERTPERTKRERTETRSLRYKLDSLHLQPPSREMESQRRERPMCDTGIIEILKSISLCINYRGVRGVSSSEMPLSVIALILSKCPSTCDDSILIIGKLARENK